MDSLFKQNLRSEMAYQDVKVKELAFRTGISARTLEGYLGQRGSIPPADVAVKIAQALGVSVEYLILGGKVVSDSANEYKNIVEQYRRLNDYNKKTVDDMLHSLLSRQIP